MAEDKFNELASYVSLLVREAGGEVRIPFATLEEGLPPNGGVKIEMVQDSEEVVFRFLEDLNEQ